jgi:hypothetical protein
LIGAIPGTLVNSNGINEEESFIIIPTLAGYYGLMIYKPDSSQFTNTINYTLSITSVSGIAEVPDNNIVAGIPLTVEKYAGGGNLLLNWGDSCDHVLDVTHYAIYRGTMANLRTGTYDHVPLFCDSGMNTTEIINTDFDDYYYLIVPTDNSIEGGYGYDSTGTSRPQSPTPCLPQVRIDCP